MRDISCGICRWEGYKDAERLYAVCGRGDARHNHDIFIYVEEVEPYVVVAICSDLTASDAACGNWFTRLVWRLWSAACILITGKISTTSVFYFMNKQSAIDYAEAITQSIERMSDEAASRGSR